MLNKKTSKNDLDLLTIGDCSIDLFMKIPDKAAITENGMNGDPAKVCFYHGSKIMVESFESSISGNSVNVGVGAKLLGINVGIYTETGSDTNADRLEKELKTYGVDTRMFIKNEGVETALHAVIVFAGERTIFSYHAKSSYKVQNWGKPKFIYYSSIGEGFESFQEELIQYKNENPDVGLVFNPGTYQMSNGINSMRNVLKVVDILIVNKEEAVKLTGTTYEITPPDLHKALHILGPKLTVITDGTADVTAFDGKQLITQGIYNDSRLTVDKTGAGDAFAAAFISAIIYGKTLQEALKWGTIDSACQVKVVGSVKGMITKEELEQKL